MEFFDFGTIFFLVAAVVIFFQLRNVLGRRTGNERPPFDPYTAGRKRGKEAEAGPEHRPRDQDRRRADHAASSCGGRASGPRRRPACAPTR